METAGKGEIPLDQKSSAVKVLETLKRIMHLVTQAFESELREIHLTGPQGFLLRHLAVHGEMKVSDISRNMGLSNSTVSGIIDRLEKQGFVSRRRSAEDRRVVKIAIDPEKCDVSQFKRRIDEKLEDIMNKASPGELQSILGSLEKLQSILSETGNENSEVNKENRSCSN